jgi:hypothetical protein
VSGSMVWSAYWRGVRVVPGGLGGVAVGVVAEGGEDRASGVGERAGRAEGVLVVVDRLVVGADLLVGGAVWSVDVAGGAVGEWL